MKFKNIIIVILSSLLCLSSTISIAQEMEYEKHRRNYMLTNNDVSMMLFYHHLEKEALEENNVHVLLGLAYIYSQKFTYYDKQKALEYFSEYVSLVEEVDSLAVEYFLNVKKDIELFEKIIESKEE